MDAHTPFHQLHGYEVVDRDGERVGTVEDVFVDAADIPTWVTVNTGLFGLREKLVPLRGATVSGAVLTVAHDADEVADAPHVDIDDDADPDYDRLRELYEHYGLAWVPPAPTPTTDEVSVAEPAVPAADGWPRRRP